jgi:hypothetical protein
VQAGPGAPFGVNVFVPGPPTDRAALDGYLAELEPDAAALGVAPGQPVWSDDDWDAKLAALLARPPTVVSFTFGCPEAGAIAALRAAGCVVWVTVTTADEAALAASRGRGGGPVRHGLPALPGEWRPPAAQGGARRPAVHRYRGHLGVHRQARAGAG